MFNWEVEAPLPGSKISRVFSPSNIALAKYWGKRDAALNLPANGSISMTLKHYGSFTTVEFNSSFQRDRVILNGKPQEDFKGEINPKVKRILDELRSFAVVTGETKLCARIQSFNNFPTGAGLASSASGMSAIAYAGAEALALGLSLSKLSEIARKGSGSACRSFFPGFAEWQRGERADGTDSVAEAVSLAEPWPLKIFLTLVSRGHKNQPSTSGMELTRHTSPYYQAWVESAQASLLVIRQAICSRDFNALAEAAESNCVRMHASAMTAEPPVVYWQPPTLEIMQLVNHLRRDGVPVFFTIDAGPNVVVVCEPRVAMRVQQELKNVGGVSLLSTELGEGTRAFNPQEWAGEA